MENLLGPAQIHGAHIPPCFTSLIQKTFQNGTVLVRGLRPAVYGIYVRKFQGKKSRIITDRALEIFRWTLRGGGLRDGALEIFLRAGGLEMARLRAEFCLLNPFDSTSKYETWSSGLLLPGVVTAFHSDNAREQGRDIYEKYATYLQFLNLKSNQEKQRVWHENYARGFIIPSW